ncbi:MAG: hypothetical protein KAX37_01810 [Opitutaceae bacterium]|nr:hypothetical protein [Opitutaceae bacterium]
MSRLIKSGVLSWLIRLFCFGPIALWLGLFLWGWHTRYLDPGPVIEGKSLYQWGELLWDRSGDEYKSAVETISQHLDIVVPVAILWTSTEESFPRSVFFSTIVQFQGKNFTIYGEEAHGYRGLGANILGAFVLNQPTARRVLERMAHDPNISAYERDIARRHLGLPRVGIPRDDDGWSPSALK